MSDKTLKERVGKLADTIGLDNLGKVFLAIRWVFMTLDWLIDLITGYSLHHGTREERERFKQSFEHGAHYVDIVGRFPFSPYLRTQPKWHLLRHHSYGNPRELMENDNITLKGVTPTHAWFVVSKEDVFEMNTPFSWITQFFKPYQFVIVSHKTLHRLASEYPANDGRKLVLIDNTARCGSTLMCQIFSRLPDTRVMSEPLSFLEPYNMYNKGMISRETFEKLVQSVAHIQFKREKKHDYNMVVMKVPYLLGPLVPVIKKALPSIEALYMIRQVKNSFESFEKMLHGFPGYNPDRIVPFMTINAPVPLDDEKLNTIKKHYIDTMLTTMPNIEQRGFSYAGSLANFKQNKSYYTSSVVFEDLTGNPKKELTELFQKLEFKKSWVEDGLTAFQFDAQANTFGSRGQKQKYYTDAEWTRVDEIFEDLGCPVNSTSTIDELRNAVAM